MVCIVVLLAIATKGVDIAAMMLGGTSHRAAAIYGFAAVCTFLSLWLVMGAVFAYLNVGQKKKIEVITGFYTPGTIADYFDQFWAGRDGYRTLVANYRAGDDAAKTALDPQLESKFKDLFQTDFGIKIYIVPAIIFVAVGAIVLFLGYVGGIGLAVAVGTHMPAPVQPFGMTFDLVSVAAIFGAYTWVASDVIVRNHQWTLHPSDLAWYALRMIIAIPLGQALALTVGGSNVAAGVTLPTGAGAFVAFVGSMFSLDSITQALGTAATRFGFQMNASTEERDDLIVKLSGVDEDKARALATEGVSTIGQLVTIDPIRVSIRTGLPFEYVLNLIDAALLWVFVGASLKPMAPLGLRGASDVLALDATWNAAYGVALNAVTQAQAAIDQAKINSDAAQAALNAAAGQPGAVLAPLQTAAANASAAVVAAQAASTQALAAFLTAPGALPGVVPNPSKMIAALTVAAPPGPGLTEVGFLTIAARLRNSTYAQFIKRLLDQ